MQPLRGLTVVSLEQAIAAPFATRQLADLGARVIKVERPGRGRLRPRLRPPRQRAELALRLGQPQQGVADARRQGPARAGGRCAGCSRPRTCSCRTSPPARRPGWVSAPTSCGPRNPRLIVCDISGYGHGGPYEAMKAYDLMVQSEAGLVSVTGTPEETAKVGISVADIAAGMYAYIGRARRAAGAGPAPGAARRSTSRCWSRTVEWMGFPLYYAYEGAPPAAAGRRRARHDLPVRPVRRRRRQGRDDGHPERARVGALLRAFPGPPRAGRRPRLRGQRQPQRPPRGARRRSSPPVQGAHRRARPPRCWPPSRWRTPT